MPTYEYECKACKHRFEARQKMTDPPLKACVKCGGKVRKLVSAGAGLIFKGSGFYITDYRSDGYKKRAKEDSPSVGTESKTASDKKSSSSESDKKS